MLDSKNLTLDISKASTTGPAGSAVQGPENTRGNTDPFSALMGDAAAKLKAAKSGNSVPLSEPSKQQGSPEALLQSRTLKGGTALIVGGAEPTDEGLIAFAQAQGMDPMALGLLSAANDSPVIISGAELLSQPQASLNIEAQSPALSSLAQSSRAQSSLVNAPGQTSALADKSAAAIAPVTADSKLGLPADKFLSDQQRLQIAQSHQTVNSPQLIKSHQLNNSAELNNSPELSKSLQPNGSPQLIDGTQLTASQLVKLSGDASAAQKNSLTEIANTANSLHIKPNSINSDAKLAVKIDMPGTQSGQPDMIKLTIGSKIADAFIKQHRERQGLPPAKLDTINLGPNKAAAVASPAVIASAPLLAVGLAPAALLVEGQAASSATTANLSSEPPAEEARQEALRRQDDFSQLSRQLTDALGKRLTAQIQRGSWHVEMELHPKTLGRVEVQLEMKNGELEARFTAANATTRDLINEGMPRLREAFQEHGTETAYKDLGAANQGASDGKSTASDKAGEVLTPGQSSDIETDAPPTGQGLAADGLDILV